MFNTTPTNPSNISNNPRKAFFVFFDFTAKHNKERAPLLRSLIEVAKAEGDTFGATLDNLPYIDTDERSGLAIMNRKQSAGALFCSWAHFHHLAEVCRQETGQAIALPDLFTLYTLNAMDAGATAYELETLDHLTTTRGEGEAFHIYAGAQGLRPLPLMLVALHRHQKRQAQA